MNKKTFIEKYLKYWKLHCKHELFYKPLERSFQMERPRIKYKIYNNCWDPNNNIEWINYITSQLEERGSNYNYISIKYKFSLTNTKFIEYYIKIDWKYYFKCFNLEDEKELEEKIEFFNILLLKNK